MNIPDFLSQFVHLILKLPTIVFNDLFFLTVGALFTVGIIVKIIKKVLL